MTEANDQPDPGYRITDPDMGMMVVYGLGLREARRQIESGESEYPSFEAYYEAVWGSHGKTLKWLEQCIDLANIMCPEHEMAAQAVKPLKRPSWGPLAGYFPEIGYCVVGYSQPLQAGYSPHVLIAVPHFDTPIHLMFVFAAAEVVPETRPVALAIVTETGTELAYIDHVSLVQIDVPGGTAFPISIGVMYPGPGEYRLKIVIDGRDHCVAPFQLTES